VKADAWASGGADPLLGAAAGALARGTVDFQEDRGACRLPCSQGMADGDREAAKSNWKGWVGSRREEGTCP
jgi:hypothetical protein